MGFFSSYIKSLLTVAVCALICNTVCEGFKGSKALEKAMAITTSLCIFITVILPVCNSLKDITRGMVSEQNEGTETAFSFTENLATATEMHINELIYKEIGTIPASTSVIISQSDYAIEKISIELQKTCTVDKGELSHLLSSSAGENTIIEITENTK